jgi:hypothetical protein
MGEWHQRSNITPEQAAAQRRQLGSRDGKSTQKELSLQPGSHSFTYYIVNTTGEKWEQTVTTSVK